MMEQLIAVGLTVLAFGFWVTNAIGLPGNWLIVLAAIGCWTLPDPAHSLAVAGGTVTLLVLICLAGEAIETIAGMLGVRRIGGATSSAWYALAGSIAGAMGGLVLGSGVPVIGNVIASLVGGALGAFAGSVYGERRLGKPWEHSMQVGSAAMFGRIFGTVAKLVCGGIALVIFIAAIWL